jgi:hypothetical protein
MIQKASTEFIEKYGVATRPHYLSAVRREIAEPRRETSAWKP